MEGLVPAIPADDFLKPQKPKMEVSADMLSNSSPTLVHLDIVITEQCTSQGGGGTFYMIEYGNVRALKVYFSSLPLYDKVCFSTSNPFFLFFLLFQ